MAEFSVYYVLIGCAVLVLSYCQTSFWMMSAERQVHRIRKAFFKAVMGQDIGWFDTSDPGEVSGA